MLLDHEQITEALKNNQESAVRQPPVPIAVRQKKLKKFADLLFVSRKEICEALAADLGRTSADTTVAELMPLLSVIGDLRRKLPCRSRRRWILDSAATFPSFSTLVPEPYGRVLVISTWNYPLLLTLEPAMGAYAAGNRVVLKLSPRAPHTAALMRRLLEDVFATDEIMPLGEEIAFDELLKFRYDYIFCTGNAKTGKEVMRAAAEYLTPVTLELGGRNPCIVDRGANLKVAAKRIVWGKFINAGQSCAAPDFLLVHRDLKAELLNLIAKYIKRFYGEHPLDSDRYCKLPDQAAYDRICELIGHGRLAAGGDRDPVRLAVEPTVLDQLDGDDPLFSGEVFGPVLPVLEFADRSEILQKLRALSKPLAIYCFGGNGKLRSALRELSSSGALVFDDTVIHFANPSFPFGGVGQSGMGAYHGRRTFETFVHLKPVMRKPSFPDWSFRYPPFSAMTEKFLNVLLRFCK